jgi:hypothetical protein
LFFKERKNSSIRNVKLKNFEICSEKMSMLLKSIATFTYLIPAQPSPAQPSPAQPSPAQPSPAQPSPAQPSPAQPKIQSNLT